MEISQINQDDNLIKHADRVLKNYRNFEKVARLSDKPFSIQGKKLAKEIERVIDDMTGLSHFILSNWYLKTPKERQSRKKVCNDYGISVDEYIDNRRLALLEFAKSYLNGALLDLK